MKKSIAAAAATLLFASIQAQQLNNVVITPNNPTECNLIDFQLLGAIPQNGQLDNFVPTINGNSITIQLNGSGGNGNNANFNQELAGFGPFTQGSYTVTVTLFYNGTQVDIWTGGFVVGPPVNPSAGDYGELQLCTSEPNFNLLTVLGGTPTPGGAWYSPTSALVPNGIFDPGTSVEGFYTYVWDVQPPCEDASQQVFVYYYPHNDPGQNTTTQVCSLGGPAFDMLTVLSGTPDNTGTWTRNGQPHSGTFTPGVDPCGSYVYTVPGVDACGPTSATLTVQCAAATNAGNNGTVQLCYTDSSENLNSHITGEPNTGFWVDPTGFFLCPYNGLVNVALNGEGNYGYVVLGNVCPNDTAFLTVDLVNTNPPCTGPIGIEELAPGLTRFALLPNPTHEQFVLELELEHALNGCSMDVLGADGRVLRNMALRANGLLIRQTVDVTDLAKGAYLVRVNTPNGSSTRRLMVR